MLSQEQVETGFANLNRAVYRVCDDIPHDVKTDWNIRYICEQFEAFSCFIVSLSIGNMTEPKKTRFSVDEANHMAADDLFAALTEFYKETLDFSRLEEKEYSLQNTMRLNDAAFHKLHEAINDACCILNLPQGRGWMVETQHDYEKTREATFYVSVAVDGHAASYRCHFSATELTHMGLHTIVDALLRYYNDCKCAVDEAAQSSDDMQWRLGAVGIARINKAIVDAKCDTYTFDKMRWSVERDFAADLTGRGFISVKLESSNLLGVDVVQRFNVAYAATAAESQLISDIEELYLRFVNKAPELRCRKYVREFYGVVADVCGRYSHIVRSFTVCNVSVDDAYKLMNDKHVYRVTLRNYKACLIQQDFDMDTMLDVTANDITEKAVVEMVKKLERSHNG